MDAKKRNTRLALAIAGIVSGAALFAGCSDQSGDDAPTRVESNGCSGANGCGGKTDAKDANGCNGAEKVETACAAKDGCGAADEK